MDTKLAPQRLRQGTLPRAALVRRLDEAVRRSGVTVLQAPAGWGKSTLLELWAATGATCRVAWFSVGGADNDPQLFWPAAIESLRRVDPRFAAAAPDPAAPFDLGSVLATVVNQWIGCPEPIALVLDNYHAVASDLGIDQLAEHLPDSARLVIASRAEPHLPLGRLRGRGAIAELGPHDLRFTLEEAGSLLSGSLELDLDDDVVEELWERCEGWAAGLYLAGLSAQRGGDPREFHGDNRFVVEYLRSEVLDGLEPALVDFLTRTSILSRMCGPLCDATLAAANSDDRLEQIERAQLFVVALDDRHRWYRYHTLFAEFLARELHRRDPHQERELHRRASGWLRTQNLMVEASDHGIAAGDLAETAELIGRTYLDCITTGSLQHVVHWLDQIPDSVVQTSVDACIARAQTLTFSNRLDKVEHWLGAAAAAVSCANGQRLSGHFASVDVAISHVRSTVSYFRGDTIGADRWAAAAAEQAAQLGSTIDGDVYVAAYIHGAVAYRNGDLSVAAQAFDRDIRRGEIRDRPQLRATALGYAALVALQQRDLRRVQHLLDQAHATIQAQNFTQLWIRSLLALCAGRLELLNAQPERALYHLRGALEDARLGPDRLGHAELLINLAEGERRTGRIAEAETHIAEALTVVGECASPGAVLSAWREHVVQGANPMRLALGLTDRQAEVLALVAAGLPSAAIAQQLVLSERTVHAHLRAIYRKLGVSSRMGAARLAIEKGLAG